MRQTTPSKAETTLLHPFAGLTLESIVVPVTAAHFAEAAAEIRASQVVGFDTESKPTFAKGEISTGPHVVQFATREKAFIFQMHQTAGQAFLLEILSSNEILKVGFGLESDHGQIQRKFGIALGAVVDLNVEFRKRGYRNTAGVRAAVAIVLNQKFHKSKRVTTSNWAMPSLTSQQLLYAANDAYAAIRVLDALNLIQAAPVQSEII